MDFEEKTMKSDKLYEGKLVNLRIDTVELPDKKYSKREIIEHPGSVCILAIREDDHIVLVKQYRKAVERSLVELPAGKIEVNEEPGETAKRELKEETGYQAEKIEYLLEYFSSPGFTNEKISVFLATDLSKGEDDQDSGEFIKTSTMHIDDLVKIGLDKNKITYIPNFVSKKDFYKKDDLL